MAKIKGNSKVKRGIAAMVAAILLTGLLAVEVMEVNATAFSAAGNTLSITNSSGSTRKWRTEMNGEYTLSDLSATVKVNGLLLRNMTGVGGTSTNTYPMKIYAGDMTGRLEATGYTAVSSTGKIPSADKQLSKNETISMPFGNSFTWERKCQDYQISVKGSITTPSRSWKGTSQVQYKYTVPAHEHYEIYYEELNLSESKCKGSDYVVTDTEPEKEGYIFCGWSTSENGEINYRSGESYSEDKSLKLYPVWKTAAPKRGYRIMFCL